MRCNAVMMCACEESFGRRVLPHQLGEASEYGSRVRHAVTIGFQPEICLECRGLPVEPHPAAEIYNRTSKIKRYYWRELLKLELEIFADWTEQAGFENWTQASGNEADTARRAASTLALKEIKTLHSNVPKYQFAQEPTQPEILAKYDVELVELKGVYVKNPPSRGARIIAGQECVTPEEFVSLHYGSKGYTSIETESVPFHVLFGTFAWLLIHDPDDERSKLIGFGDRHAFEAGEKGETIYCSMPEDLGLAEYGRRRRTAIDRHCKEMLDSDDWEWLFDYWLSGSENLRQYLWAHRKDDIDSARQILKVLPKNVIMRIFRYLVNSYWERYLGWPDLLVFKGNDWFFAEVKSSKDSLSANQKRWIQDNYCQLKLPFKLVKIHKAGTIDVAP